MTEAKIRDYEADTVVGVVTTEGIKTEDKLLTDVAEDLSDGVEMLWPGDDGDGYISFTVEPGEEGYVRAVVDELPSPFDIDDMGRLDELPDYAPKEVGDQGGSKAAQVISLDDSLPQNQPQVIDLDASEQKDSSVDTPDWIRDMLQRVQQEFTGEVGAYNALAKVMDVDVFRIVTTEEIEDEYDGDLLAVGVDLPNHDVFVDWKTDAWPDDQELKDPHVSIYGNMDDLEQVTEGEIEYVTTVDPSQTEKARVYVDDPSDAPDDANVQEGDQGGYYYETGGGDGSEDGLDEDQAEYVAEELRAELGERGAHALIRVLSDYAPEMSEALMSTLVLSDDKMWKSMDWDELNQILFEAYEVQIWEEKFEKTMWENDSEVPDFVQRWIDEVIDMVDPLWDRGFDDVPKASALRVHNEITSSLTQPQGWSINSITKRVMNEFDWMELEHARTIVRQEVASVLNKAREIAYRARPDSDDFLFEWIGPDDSSTTQICTEIKEEIESRGGGVPLDDLKSILREKAKQYQDRGGTPNRVEENTPHYQCRHTLKKVEEDA